MFGADEMNKILIIKQSKRNIVVARNNHSCLAFLLLICNTFGKVGLSNQIKMTTVFRIEQKVVTFERNINVTALTKVESAEVFIELG